MNRENPFLDTIFELRTQEALLLFSDNKKITEREELVVVDFLEEEYAKESTGYPFTAPAFQPDAALWAAKIFYFAAQFFLNRKDSDKQMAKYFPAYSGTITVAEMLSADLVLRFLPALYTELKRIDFEDSILVVLVKHLNQFPYSAINMDAAIEVSNIENLFANPCFRQLYLNRITERKALQWTETPLVQEGLKENFGAYKNIFWRALEYTKLEEQNNKKEI
jgi:MoxR-vWA-beta-propeller ternary system domain bpX4